ncbi:hypothetical protein A7U43_27265 [Mycobacterium adipatum]|uniref:DUF4242 domain-containing protein n=1 Tax=Mycobacterium adipatum TaxID=1682113 RepID=A0A172UTX9_9MYCO|nr:DUF4242 domain-containing protein [Mycobacterium adipatum]ANE82468.1 hypothetical protein A7U43_27265 [Mycobacterium adipatum]
MDPAEPCYLVEWYQPALVRGSLERTSAALQSSAAAASALGPTIQLMSMIVVPTDEMVFGVFCAASADLVSKVCRHAGLPADRLTAATDIRLAPTSPA